ncbi:hypothetical protein [Ruania zhangjianzhongii]|uniref:hypothetical protein n=1 Tax=Ruania zhangjianzhongii TaxID=2603206 RepID=UPI0011CB10D6|nr:hypothetical protein [Ruania zhangjianzhongii]
MLINDHLDTFAEFIPQGATWLADGTLRAESTIVTGLDRAPEAFIDLFRGANVGKMLIQL